MDYEKAISWITPKSFNLDAEKKQLKRKLAIIDLIELCNEYLNREYLHLADFGYLFAMNQTKSNIKRYEKIKYYLLERYNRN